MDQKPASYILSMACVSGDDLQVAIHRREDIFRWIRELDHEGANWDVIQHHWSDEPNQNGIYQVERTVDITADILREMQQ